MNRAPPQMNAARATSPLAPVLRGEGSGERGTANQRASFTPSCNTLGGSKSGPRTVSPRIVLRTATSPGKPLSPSPSPPRTGARGDRLVGGSSRFRRLLVREAYSGQHRRLTGSAGASPSHQRSGLTLFEVLISLVIFVGAMAAIGQLVSNGVRGALQARFQAEAALLCEAKLAEVVAGIVPLQSAQGVNPNDPKWTWTLLVTAAPVPGLLRAEVTVKRQATNSKGVVSFNLARYVRDPQLYYAAQQEAERNKADQEASSSK